MSAATSTAQAGSGAPFASALPTNPIARFLHDTWAVVWRELRLTLRDPFSQVFALGQPLVFLVLFAPLLSGVVGGGWQERERRQPTPPPFNGSCPGCS